VAGIFVGVALLAPLLRGHLSVPVIVLAAVVLALVVALGGQGSLIAALLNAIMIGAFYGLLFLAIRLGEAYELAERLVVELEASQAAQAEAAGLAERQRVAREMHDVLAHSLSGLQLQLEGARMLAADNPTDPRLRQVIARAQELGRTGLDEARRAIGALRDDDLPGPERLPELAAQFQQDRGIACRLAISGQAHALGPEARLAVYRVAQEALTNVARHARPDWVELRMDYQPSTTRLIVEDFAAAPADPRRDGDGPDGDGGYGLTGMRERAELLGGTLTTAPTPTGFRVELEVPA
jgi:signal transduction histidine kinase